MPRTKKIIPVETEATEPTLIAEPATKASLTKEDLLILLDQKENQNKQLIEHIEMLENNVNSVLEDNANIRQENSKFSDRVVKVLSEMERFNKARMEAIFQINRSMEVLVSVPSFEKEDTK